MNVEVRLFANFREITGKSKLYTKANDVSELLENISEKHEELAKELFEDKEKKKLKKFVNIMINGKTIEKLDGLDTRLEDGDKIAIFPPVTGG